MSSFVPNTFGSGFPRDDLHNDGYKLFIASTTFVILAAMFVGLRIWVRLQKHNAGADDATIFISLMFSVSLTVCMDLAVSNGYGVRKSDLSKPQLREAMKWFFFSQIVYKIVIMFTKMSLILLYLRIFIAPGFRIACFIALSIVLAWSIGSIISTILQCIPIEASWNTTLEPKTCINSDAAWYQYGVLNILTDVMILALPVKQVLSLQLGKRERLGLLFVFLVGAFVCIVSICRVIVVANSTQMKEDVTGNFIPRSSLTLVEANVGIICACLPMLRQPLSFLFPNTFSRGSQSYELSDSAKPQLAYPKVQNSVSVSSARKTGSAGDNVGSIEKGDGRSKFEHRNQMEESDEEPLTSQSRPPKSTRNSTTGIIKVTRDYEIQRG